MLSVKQGNCEYNFKVIGLTRFGIKPESTAQEADALYGTTRASELLNWLVKCVYRYATRGTR